MSTTEQLMREALVCAQTAADLGEVPVGAIIAQQGRIIARAHNRTQGTGNVLGHAEYLVIQEALSTLNQSYLDDCILFVTLEPCAMCAGAIALARVGRVYFGAYDAKSGGTDHGARVFDHPQCHWKPQVYGGILERECGALLTDFFATRR